MSFILLVMLDDEANIRQIDKSDALAVAASQPQQLKFTDFKFEAPSVDHLYKVVLTGMGGSALAGLLLRSWLDDILKLPFVITRDYTLPGFVGKYTLVIVSSYSGNTEETLAAATTAENKGATVVAMTSGGKLAELAKSKDWPLLSLPTGYQPRMATWFGLKMLAAMFDRLGLTEDAASQLETAHQFLKDSAEGYLPKVATTDNQAKQIAQALFDKTVVIYGSPLLAAAAYKWKIDFNENAKNLAFCNSLPEFDHNEFIGWTAKPATQSFGVVELASSFDDPQITKRFSATNRLLAGKMPAPIEIKAAGDTKLAQILWTVLLGDFTSLYLAILNQVDPTPVDLVEKLKTELS